MLGQGNLASTATASQRLSIDRLVTAKMNVDNFTTIYASVMVLIALLVLFYRLKANANVLSSSPIKAEVVGVEKDVDVITQITVRFKQGNYPVVIEVKIDPMYNKTSYEIGDSIKAWSPLNNPNMVFLKKPNAMKLIAKAGFPAFLVLFIMWFPLILIFRGNISM